jgi:hypothetical protein
MKQELYVTLYRQKPELADFVFSDTPLELRQDWLTSAPPQGEANV